MDITYQKRYLEINSFFRSDGESRSNFSFKNSTETCLAKVRKISLKSFSTLNGFQMISGRNNRLMYELPGHDTLDVESFYNGSLVPLVSATGATIYADCRVIGDPDIGFKLLINLDHTVTHITSFIVHKMVGTNNSEPIETTQIVRGDLHSIISTNYQHTPEFEFQIDLLSNDIVYTSTSVTVVWSSNNFEQKIQIQQAEVPHLVLGSTSSEVEPRTLFTNYLNAISPDGPRVSYRLKLIGAGHAMFGEGKYTLFVAVNPRSFLLNGRPVDNAFVSSVRYYSIFAGNPIEGAIRDYRAGSSLAENIYLSTDHVKSGSESIVVEIVISANGVLYPFGITKSTDHAMTVNPTRITRVLPIPKEYGQYPYLTSNNTVLGLATNSSGTVQPYLMFDSSTTTQWRSLATYSTTDGSYTGSAMTVVDGVNQPGEWVSLKLPNRFVINKVKMFTNSTTALWQNWVVAGSLDGLTWFTLRDEAAYPINNNQADIVFEEKTIIHLRLIIRSNVNLATSVSLDNFHFFGHEVVDQSYAFEMISRNNYDLSINEWICFASAIYSQPPPQITTRDDLFTSIPMDNFSLCFNPSYIGSESDRPHDIILRGVRVDEHNTDDVVFPTDDLIVLVTPYAKTIAIFEFSPKLYGDRRIKGWDIIFLPLADHYIHSDNVWETQASSEPAMFTTVLSNTSITLNNVQIFYLDEMVIQPVSSLVVNISSQVILSENINDYVMIPNGDYTITSLMEALILAFQAKGIVLQRPINDAWLNTEGKLLFSFDQAVNLFQTHPKTGAFNPMSYVLGISRPNNFVTMFTADSIPDLSGISYLYLRSAAICQGHCLISGSNLSAPVFAIIPINPVGGLLVYNEAYPDQFSITYQQPTQLSFIDISVTDQLGLHVSLESDSNFVFELVYEQ